MNEMPRAAFGRARFAGKVVFVTGAGSGIGKAAAHLFAAEGAKVAIAEIQPQLGRATEESIRASGSDALFVETDITVEESIRTAIEQTMVRFGALHVIYNCAGGSIPRDGPVTTVDMSVWDHTVSLDLKGTFLGCRHGIPAIIQSGGGAVVNMSSIAALMGIIPRHVYAAAKGAIISLTQAMAAEYAKHGVRVNAICPGLALSDRAKGGEAALRAGRWANHPFAFGQPADIAHIALFLASDESRMITGATIPADGGLSAY